MPRFTVKKTVEINKEPFTVKNCPCCGGDANIHIRDDWDMVKYRAYVQIRCENCGISTEEYNAWVDEKDYRKALEGLYAKVINIWNLRTGKD